MAKVGIGLIGCGGRLRGVVKELFYATQDVEIVALCDPNEKSIEAAKEAFNAEATVHESVEALVNDPAVEWVMIGSWNCYHAEHTIAAFEAGKHVFCEKPLALTVEDCIAMRKSWLKSGKSFTIGFTLRYSPHYVRIKEILEAGTIGDIVSMEFNETLDFNHGGYIHADWRRKTEWAGSHLLEKCCHDIDLVNWMVESTAVKVASFGGCDFFNPGNEHHRERLGPNKDGKEAFQTWSVPHIAGNITNPFTEDKDILDNQVAIVQFANGVRSTFHTNCNCAIPERRMYICGTEGTLRADVMVGSIEVKRIGWDTEIETLSTESSGGHGGGDSILGQSLAATIHKGEPSRTSLEDGLRAAFTAFGIDEAERTGTIVDLTPLWEKAGIEVAGKECVGC
ncbi:MAG: Gfo/Idh/MocA family protein [Planctomycetota bacterium]|jgi:predicted dehydrogenase